MLAVEETSRALLGASRTKGRTPRVEADSMTWELAAYGPSLNALRAVARLHKISLEEAIRNALDDYISTQGISLLDGIGATLAQHQEAMERGEAYP